MAQSGNSSLSDADTSGEVCEVLQTRKRRKLKWTEIGHFDTEDAAIAHMAELGNYGWYYDNDPLSGLATVYRCKNVKLRGSQCDAMLKIKSPSDDKDFVLSKIEKEHNCDEILKSRAVKRMTATIRAEIQRRHEARQTASFIWDDFGRQNLNNIRQVYNCINGIKKRSNNITTLGDLIKWCEDNTSVPANNHQPFVLAYFTAPEHRQFRAIITTKQLLQLFSKGDRLHADGTYNLMVENFPTIVFGTTDSRRSFVLGGIAICSSEQEDDYEFVFKAIANYYQDNNIEYSFR